MRNLAVAFRTQPKPILNFPDTMGKDRFDKSSRGTILSSSATVPCRVLYIDTSKFIVLMEISSHESISVGIFHTTTDKRSSGIGLRAKMKVFGIETVLFIRYHPVDPVSAYRGGSIVPKFPSGTIMTRRALHILPTHRSRVRRQLLGEGSETPAPVSNG